MIFAALFRTIDTFTMNTSFDSTKSPLLSSIPHLAMPSTMALMSLHEPTPTSTKRCNAPDCKRKLMLTDFDCKCAIRFCSQHRMPETHGCTFNFRAAADVTLTKQLGKAADTRMLEKI